MRYSALGGLLEPIDRDIYRCRLCGKTVRAFGNFGGGAIRHARMHVDRGEAEQLTWGGKRNLEGRFTIINKEARDGRSDRAK